MTFLIVTNRNLFRSKPTYLLYGKHISFIDSFIVTLLSLILLYFRNTRQNNVLFYYYHHHMIITF